MKDYFPQSVLEPLVARKASSAIAVGGTLVMAAKAMGAKVVQTEGNFSKQDVAFVVTRESLVEFMNKVRKISSHERSKIPKVEIQRADILPTGLLCLCTVLKLFSCEHVFITSWGLRHGILLKWDEV